FGLDEHFFGGGIEPGDQLIGFHDFTLGGDEDQLAGAAIGDDLAAFVLQDGLDIGHHVGGVAVFKLDYFGDERVGRGGILDGDVGDVGLRIINDGQVI